MLPNAALIPPCAATVCERVGNNLDIHATSYPFSANPMVARSPAPPAPMTIASKLCSTIFDGLVEKHRFIIFLNMSINIMIKLILYIFFNNIFK